MKEQRPLPPEYRTKFTSLQRETLVMMCKGLTNREIIDTTSESPSNLYNRIDAIKKKLHTTSRFETVMISVGNGDVGLNEVFDLEAAKKIPLIDDKGRAMLDYMTKSPMWSDTKNVAARFSISESAVLKKQKRIARKLRVRNYIQAGIAYMVYTKLEKHVPDEIETL